MLAASELPLRDLSTSPIAPRTIATAVALPPHCYAQRDVALRAAKNLPSFERREGFLVRFFERAGVEQRYFALPAEAYPKLTGFEDRSRAYLEVGIELGERCIRSLLDEAGVHASEISQLTTTTVTGIAVPSIDARLMNRIPFSASLKRVPLFGLGCLGGAAGLARVMDYLRAYPGELAILLSIELCSLTLQTDDPSMANIVSLGLFGDGASAVLLAGAKHPLARSRALPGPELVASRSAFFRNTERVMGWDVVDHGFRVVLSTEVPDVVRREVPTAVDAFLAEHDLTRDDIVTWVAHPGGPKVVEALEESLGLDEQALRPSREILRRIGNLSSASVLCLLDDFRRRRLPAPGDYGILMAMGPAFCAELVLLRW